MPVQTAIAGRDDGAELPRAVLHYELRRVLGRGGFSIVYEAWDARLCRAVAVKCLLQPEQGPRGSLHEARMTARVKHPAFVTVYELLPHEGLTFLVMELIDGRTLGEITADGPVPSDTARRWALEAAVALQAAHGAGVVHGDVKPSNLMIDTQGRLRILDLGVATARDPEATQDLATLGDNAGTLAYMAPELMLGAQPSPASDVFALGLTLYRVVAGPGRVPANTLALAHQRLAQDLALVAPGVDARFLALLQEMTRRDPAARLGDLGGVVARLRQLDGAEAVPVAAPTHKVPLKPWALALLTAALVSAGTWGWVHWAGAPVAAPDVAAAERSLRLPDDAAGMDQAIATLEAALADRRTPPARVAAALAIAYCMRYAGNNRDPVWLDRAAASAQLALKTEDQLALAHTAQAWVLELQERLDAAEAEYVRALGLDPSDFHALNGQAQLLMRQGHADAAVAAFQRALQAYPDEPVFLNGLGSAYFRLGQLDQAAAAFRQSIAAQPKGALAYASLNGVLTRQGRVEEALSVLQQGLAFGPDARLYGNLGASLYALGRFVEAADAFERAISADKGSPNHYRNWANLGDALRMIPGRAEAATQAYRRALALLRPQLGPQADRAQLSRAGLYAAKIGDATLSRPWTEASLAGGSRDADAWFRAAVAAELLGERDVALQRVHTAMSLGYPAPAIEQEAELHALRRDRRFPEVMADSGRKP